MKFIILTGDTAHELWHKEFRSLYQKKISHFYEIQFVQIDSSKSTRKDKQQKLQQESTEFLKFLKDDDYVVLFDEHGKEYPSIEFSKWLEGRLSMGKKRMVFIIGGPYGVSHEIKQRSDQKIQLAPWTLNHLVAEAVALEQVYRACTLIHNIPYHNS